MRVKRKRIEWAILAVAVIAIGVLAGAAPEGKSRLVSVQQLPDAMSTCTMDDFSAATSADADAATPREETLLAELQQDPQAAPQQRTGQRGGGDTPGSNAGGAEGGEGGGFFGLPHTAEQLRVTEELRAKGARVPVRTIRDTAPSYSSVAVDVNSNEVIMTDNNLWSYRVFDRLAPTPCDRYRR